VPISHEEFMLLLRQDFMGFIERSFRELNPQTKFVDSPHVEVMASWLEDCRSGKIRRLIVNLPPRSLKSHVVSVAFVAWLLGHDPAAQIICASYGQDLSDKHARDCRTLMLSAFYRRLFPRTELSSEKQSVNEFATNAQGFRMSTSVGGVLTGRGADLIILDDPLKPDDALSETRRNHVNEWFDNSLLSRLNNKQTGSIIIVMQRLHQDDLVGHVLDQGEWQVLSLPAIAEEDEVHAIKTPWGKRWSVRKAGEVLQPERESKQTFVKIRETIGEYNFASQYQQCPLPQGGAIVKTEWLRRYEPTDLPRGFICIVQSWDTANKSGELNDFSVCTTWGVVSNVFYLLHVFRKRLNYPALKQSVKEQSLKHGAQVLLIEDKASGTQLIQDLGADGVCGIKPYTPPSGSDKILRLYAQTAEFESGRVRLPSSAPWLDDYLRELTTFPGSKYDDQVDSTTQALDHRPIECTELIRWDEKAGLRGMH
jgi:predicted phage terminase large subunit-like protein